jgi:hypothetical protein
MWFGERSLTPGALFFVAVTLSACTGSIGFVADVGRCDSPNARPMTPSLVTPRAGEKGVVVAGLAFTATPFADPDADTHVATEVEIWTTVNGQLVTRVWSAHLDGARTSAALADGSFDSPFTALSDWSDYAARVRYLDDHQGQCGSWSEWSAAAPFRTDDGSAALFDPAVIREFRVELPQSSIDAMNAEAIPPDCVPWSRSYQPGSVVIDGVRFDDVGVKIKGGCGSARDFNGKPGLKIKLDWDNPATLGCPDDDRRYLGIKSFTLNNQVQDPSATHERLAYAVYRAMGVPAARAAHARVYVNDQLFGVYLHVETEDRRFMARRFESEDGMLYEGTYWCDLVAENLPVGDTDDKCLTREFSPDICSTPDPGADPLTYDPLRELVSQLAALPPGGFYPEVGAFFDYDEFLRLWAVESVIAHWDNYAFDIRNNYRVYHDPVTDRWSMIPHGVDQTFRENQDIWAAVGILAARCLEEPDCEAAYAARVHEVLALWPTLDLPGQAVAVYEQIRSDVYADPRKEYGNGEFDNQHQQLLQWIAARPQQVLGQLAQRGY